MRKYFLGMSCMLLLFSMTIISWKSTNKTNTTNQSPARELFEKYVDEIYQAANLQQSGLDEVVFQKAVTGFMNLKATNKLSPFSTILTVVDYNKSSREKRMWIVDLINKELILNTWVAHGSASGDDIADNFSNTIDSHQSSLGFYITNDVYFGKHGRSLHLEGLDEGFNTNARNREIVVHGADYVSENTINELGRLGRSWGCPAVAPEVANEVIDAIKGKTVLFINGNDSNYTSKYLDENASANYVFHGSPANEVYAQN